MWSCDPVNPKLEVAPVYVHSKVCIIDDQWVAIGTANVDGASMNARQWQIILPGTIQELLRRGRLSCRSMCILCGRWSWPCFSRGSSFRDIGAFMRDAARREFARFTQHANPNVTQQPPRHPEIILALFDGIAGQPASGRVKELRKILWKEHLGAEPPDARPPERWVGHWKHKAFEYQERIRDGAIFGSGTRLYPEKVLKWSPERDFDKYLEALGVPVGGILLRGSGETMPFKIKEALP